MKKEYTEQEEEQMRERILSEYIVFKKHCFNKKIFDLDEIIKLFEVWINSL